MTFIKNKNFTTWQNKTQEEIHVQIKQQTPMTTLIRAIRLVQISLKKTTENCIITKTEY